jgi:ubiquinone/menaquinone biosynthesis C-methylase UbiE
VTRGGSIAAAYDGIADRFERQRVLPDGVAPAVRTAVLSAIGPVDRPRLLDLGAGSGRFGWPFVAAGDDYVGVDLSAGMLRAFAERCAGRAPAMLVRADGCGLPFRDAGFDAVLMVAVFGDRPDWRRLVDEARRALRPHGLAILGRTAASDGGIDERLKQHLDTLLAQRLPRLRRRSVHEDAASYLAAVASATTELVAANWSVEASPRRFIERHAEGARFSRLPLAVRQDAMRALADWARTEFGTLDAAFTETRRFEMQLFRFAGE